MSCNSLETRPRSAGLDLIRMFAILFVIGGHFFLNTDFNFAAFGGAEMFALSMWQTLILINVPLFLILTGYLNLNKRISKKYYVGGIRVILTYLLISLITITFRMWYLGEHQSAAKWVLKITDFSIIPYGWFVEMWIGLFLLTPFLNILWRSIGSKRHRLVLVFTLFLLTALPDFFNRYGVSLVPGFWTGLFPVSYFYVGAYIREYQPNPRRLYLWLAIIGLCLINPLANLGVSVVSPRPMLHLIGSERGIVAMPLATLFFIVLYRIEINSRCGREILKRISNYSLDMYLISWIFDQLVYPFVLNIIGWSQLPWLSIWILAVPSVFILSFLTASITYNIEKSLLKPSLNSYPRSSQ